MSEIVNRGPWGTTRREFLNFMGRSAALTTLAPYFTGCATSGKSSPTRLPVQPISPSRADNLLLSEGLNYEILLSWGDVINSKQESFGYNNDYIAFIPLNSAGSQAILWVNHEYHDPYWVGGWRHGEPRTLAQIDKERRSVGGSLVHIAWDAGRWRMVTNSKYNRRIDAFTKIPLIADEPIFNSNFAIGTLGNCAGGVTPWGTILTCEENYQNFVGEVVFEKGKRILDDGEKYLSWMKYLDLPPEHYGWVVEVNPKSGSAKKLTALGRFAHECATTVLASDGRTVVYSGDDSDQEHIYKFISKDKGSLERGQLYVASLEKSQWLPLNWYKDQRLKSAFKSPTEMLIRTREAAKIVGATPLDRPEDVEIDPITGDIFISLTNSKQNNNPFGSLLRISPNQSDHLSDRFAHGTFAAGGEETGFACPDNLAFDQKGNLWMTTDISGSAMNKAPYTLFGNNGLFFIPLKGEFAGRAFQVASAPTGAELTGPCFSSDGRTLFLSVQHPGEHSHDPNRPSSHWPHGGNDIPRPSVIAIRGSALDHILGIH